MGDYFECEQGCNYSCSDGCDCYGDCDYCIHKGSYECEECRHFDED